MNGQQALVIALLIGTMTMFIIGRWRHDLVAAGALMLGILAGLIPGEEAFAGFGHPAVITVACILILSSGLQMTGAVDLIAHKIIPNSAAPLISVTALISLGAALSAFMNNVGAMALLMPVAVKLAAKHDLPPGKILMPLSFGTILGGTVTMMGTPPNLIVSGFRAETGAGAFGIFDFSPVGLSITLAGIVFLALAGWRLVPSRKETVIGKFDTGKYLTEIKIPKGSKLAGKTFSSAEKEIEDAGAQVLGMIRNNIRIAAPNPRQLLREDDILIVEAEPEGLSPLLSKLGLSLEEEVLEEEQDKGKEAKPGAEKNKGKKKKENGEGKDQQQEIILAEFVVMPYSKMIGRSASHIKLRTRYGINLLAISRRGTRSIKRLRSTVIRAGDVLLMQGEGESLFEFSEYYRLAPLAERSLSIPNKKLAIKAAAVMAGAVSASTVGNVPVAVSFAAAVIAFLLLKIIPIRSVYDSVDWPVIVLLGAMLPIAGAVYASGAADLIAGFMIDRMAQGSPVAGLAVILVVTMVATDFMNNAAIAAVMCPIALRTATQLEVNPDTFLMAVAVGASCAFLTPIGHQNNTLILGPGGFRFGDYWRVGLPLEIIVAAISIPALLWIWPL